MDLQQEHLARSLGDGHRVIHGVAGSGKTMILAYRCQHLAQGEQCENVSSGFNYQLHRHILNKTRFISLRSHPEIPYFRSWF
jgi:superfamily I DNA and RNA helicase